MNYMKKLTAALAMASAIAFSGIANADTFVDLGADDKWETAANWQLNAVPLNNGSGNTLINVGDVVFDADTWAALQTAGNVQSATQYRVVRFLLNESTSIPVGTGSITFDHGSGNQVLQTNGTSAVFGSRTGLTTVNMLSGEVNTGSSTTFGARSGTGILNLADGNFIVGRGNLTLGNGSTGTGIVNITGGVLRTRGGAIINDISTFEVIGTGASEIGIGSQGTVDGFWTQQAGGVLRSGIDSTGITSILIDDVGGGGGDATFAAGSILDPYDAGGALENVWETVLLADGTITGSPTLSSTAVAAGWESQIINGNELQVRLVSAIPEPSSMALLGLGGLFFAGRRRR